MSIYEQLAGQRGRKVFFRAERFAARDLFHSIVPEIEVDERPLALHDLSMSGLGVVAQGSASWTDRLGAEVPVRLRIGGTNLYEGRGKICRVARLPYGTKLGIGLVSGYLDIPSLVARQKEFKARHALEDGFGSVANSVAPGYRKLTADTLYMLRRYKAALDELGTGTNGAGPPDPVGVSETLAFCEERIVPEWRELWLRANELARPVLGDPDAMAALKRFTELLLTPEFSQGPIWKRSYEKPRGYPGDFEMMKQVYAWKWEGATPYAKLVHRLGLEVAECIATRMVVVQQTIARTLAARPGGPMARIASLGCGPAQEIYNALQVKSLPRPVAFTLMDQEHQALSWSYERLYPETLRFNGSVRLKCLEISFMQLMKAHALMPALEPQDLIYVIGLIDYLTPRRAHALVAKLYQQLAPGGKLLVGNMRDTAMSNLWPMEFVCDWSVNYRNESEMWALAEGLNPASAELKTDPTGRVYLLFLTKA